MKQTEQKWGIGKLLLNPIYVHDDVGNATKAPRLMKNQDLALDAEPTINLAPNSATSIGQVAD